MSCALDRSCYFFTYLTSAPSALPEAPCDLRIMTGEAREAESHLHVIGFWGKSCANSGHSSG